MDATSISGPPAHDRAFAALPAGCGLIAGWSIRTKLRIEGRTRRVLSRMTNG
jgi:hypothetical protein